MIVGIGIDIIELERVRDILKRQPKFVDRILTEDEKEYYLSLGENRKIEWFAGRFSAKEAFSKANGTGIGGKLSFQDISIIPDKNGKPMIKHPLEVKAHLSITHTKQYAAAQVLLEKR
jgi:holo-[acyl-carrier protein] synthase